MTKRITGICAVVLYTVAIATSGHAQEPAPAAANVVSLQEAINTALNNSNAVTAARATVNRSVSQIRETRAAGLPQVRGQAQAQRTGPVPEVTIAPGETITLGSPTSATASVSLSQVIDVNRRVNVATDISELAAQVQRFDLARTEQQLVLNVQNAYYNVLRTEQQRDVAQAAVNSSQERLRIARAQFEAGTLPRFDVTRAEVELANRQQTLLSATNTVSVNKAVLRTVMGIDPTEPITVQPVTIEAQPVTVDVDQSVQTALTRRPEVATAETNVLLQRRSVEFAQRERIPALAAFASYNYDANTSFFQPNNFSWVLGVNASVPIFDAGAISSRVNQARSDVAIAQANLDQQRLDVALDVQSAVLNLNDAYQRIQTAGQSVDEAEEALRLAQVRYEAGISLQVEVIDAETALVQARTNLVNATYDYATALARYQRATATQPQFATAAPAQQPQPSQPSEVTAS